VIYTQHYDSPLGGILLAADDTGLTGLWFEGQKYFARTLDAVHQEQETAVLSEARRWLDVYFGGQEPDFTPPLHPAGSSFQQEVWALLRRIPCGQTTTYGVLARQLAAERGLSRMSAQAVGGAVGRNVISIIIPCHRVVGTNGSLTGYAGGIEKKGRAAETGNENDAVRNTVNEKIRTFSRWEEVRIFLVWWRRWESNPCPKRVQRRCLRVQAINNIPSASRRSPG